MKALSIQQPYATLVAIGAKRYETRSWHTAYRGPLAIHAAKRYPLFNQRTAQCVTTIATALEGEPIYRGMILAVAQLIACYRVEEALVRGMITPTELTMGFYSPGRWAWELAFVQTLSDPVPATGQLGLWTWEPR